MVEFAVAILAALPCASSTSESNLRVAANQRLVTKSWDPAEARAMVNGLLHETSAEDLNVISNSFTTLKTETFTALETKTSVSVPDNVSFTPSFWPGCRWCPNADALTDSNTVAGHTTSSFEVVAGINVPNHDDSALMINDTTTVFARFAQHFWSECRWFPEDDAIALNDSPILKGRDVA